MCREEDFVAVLRPADEKVLGLASSVDRGHLLEQPWRSQQAGEGKLRERASLALECGGIAAESRVSCLAEEVGEDPLVVLVEAGDGARQRLARTGSPPVVIYMTTQ